MSNKWVVHVDRSGHIGIYNRDADTEWYGKVTHPDSIIAIKSVAQKECDKRNKEIEDKKFDITKYQFTDPYIVRLLESIKVIQIKSRDGFFNIKYPDSQAIARHFYDRAEDKEAFINKIKGES
jgi:hypothetical protein